MKDLNDTFDRFSQKFNKRSNAGFVEVLVLPSEVIELGELVQVLHDRLDDRFFAFAVRLTSPQVETFEFLNKVVEGRSRQH